VFTDQPLDQLQHRQATVAEPTDFAEFWCQTVAEAREYPVAVKLDRVSTSLRAIEVWEVRFGGWGGEPISAWLLVPADANRPLPAVVQFHGYGGGRGHPLDELAWAAAGYAHLVMDNRGQGAGWSVGQTPDPHGTGPQVPGMMTKGIDSREAYYYRRLMTDAVRAVDAVASLELVDPDRLAVTGGSQGGALALAATAWSGLVKAADVRVPFLADIPHALQLTDTDPYGELVRFLASRPQDQAQARVFEVLAYFDAANLARCATAPAVFSVGLIDEITPASTVFAAYNNYAGPKDMAVYRFNGHEAGGTLDLARAIAFFDRQLGVESESTAERSNGDVDLLAGGWSD